MAIPYFTMRRLILDPEKLDQAWQLAVQDQSSWAQDALDQNQERGNTPPRYSKQVNHQIQQIRQN